MFFFIFFRKPFKEPALNYANLVTELTIAVIVPLIATFAFGLSANVSNGIDITLIVLINFIVVAQMLASIYIFLKTIKAKLVDRKKNQVRNYDQEKQEVERERYKIQIRALEANIDEDEISFYSNHVYNTPVVSARTSVLNDIFIREDSRVLNSPIAVSGI